MSNMNSIDTSRDSLLPIEEQEKDDLYVQKTSRVRRIIQLASKRRFYTNGLSIIHQALFITLSIVAIHIAYLQGLKRVPPRTYKSFVPQIGPASGPVTFTDSAEWSGNTSQAAVGWNRWLQNFETHTIAIPRPSIEEFGYEPGLPDTKNSERFGISMFHQLHCLATIREFAYLPDAMRMPDGKPLDHHGVSFSPFHMDHCFNYLRQALECFADSTVEWSRIDEAGERVGIQGWGIPHNECRDRNALEAFALKHHSVTM